MAGRHTIWAFCIGLAAAAVASSAALAQAFPSRQITLVLPFAAGGPTDTISRILAERMRVGLGHPVIVENAPGTAGVASINRVVRANPDGHILSVGPWNSHVVAPAIYPVQFDILTDLAPVALLASNPSVIVTKNAVPATTLRQLVDWVKSNQSKISAGTSGVGTATHIGALFFQKLTGTDFALVPYRGAGPAMQDLISGQTDIMFDQLSNSLPQIRAGQIKAYAVMSGTRAEAAPELPTVDEAGLPGFHLPVWHGMWAPKSTPRDVLAKLNSITIEALSDVALRKRFSEIGQEIPGRESLSSLALADYHRAEIEKWWPVIKAANIKPD